MGRVVLIVVLVLAMASPAIAAPVSQDVPVVELSGAGLSALVALLVSLALQSVPALAKVWEAFGYKREVLIGFGFVLAWALVGLHYLGAITLQGVGAWGWPVVWQTLTAWVVYIGTGQGVYSAGKLLVKLGVLNA